MAMKVKCSAPECGSVFEVSDDQAGQTILCPECGAPVRVPAAGAEDHFRDIKASAGGEGKVAHPARQLCPNCGATLGVRTAICPQCGADIRTGAVAQVARRKVRDWRIFAIGGGVAVGLLVLIVMVVVAANLLKERAKKAAEAAAAEVAKQAEAAATKPVQEEPKEVRPRVVLTEADFGTLPQQENDIKQAVNAYKTRLNDALAQMGKADSATAATLWADLAAFCKENGLLTEGEMCWLRAARLAPDNAAVNAKLGRTETFAGKPVTTEQKQFLESLRPVLVVVNRAVWLSGYSIRVAGGTQTPFGWTDVPQFRPDAGDVSIELIPPADSKLEPRSVTLNVRDGLRYTVAFADPGGAPALGFDNLSSIFAAVTNPDQPGNATVERDWQGGIASIHAGNITATSAAGAPLAMQLAPTGTLTVTGLLTMRSPQQSGNAHAFWGSAEVPLRLHIDTEAKTVGMVSGIYARVTSRLADGLLGVLATAQGDVATLWNRTQLSQGANDLARVEVEQEAAGEIAAPWRGEEASYTKMAELQRQVSREIDYTDHAYARPPGVDCARAVGVEDRVAHLYLNWPRFRPALTAVTEGCTDAILEMVGPRQSAAAQPAQQAARRGPLQPGGVDRERPQRDITDRARGVTGMPGMQGMPGVSTLTGAARAVGRTEASPLAPPQFSLDEATRRYALMRVLAVLPDEEALRWARDYWRSVDYEGKVAALVSLESVGTPAVVSFLGELSREETDVDVIAAALLSLGGIGTPEALRYCETPGVVEEVRTASLVARAIAGDPEVLADLPNTLAKSGDRRRQMILNYAAEADSPATLVILSAAIDACKDAKARAQIAAGLVRIGGHAAMMELARLMQTDGNLYPDLLASVEPGDATMLVRMIGTAAADGKGTPETVNFLLKKGGEAGQAFLRAAAVNQGSAPVLAALLDEGTAKSIETLADAAPTVDQAFLTEVRKRWYTVGATSAEGTWRQGVDTGAAGDFLRAVFEKGKDPKVRLCAAWMMTEVGDRPDTQKLLSLTEVQAQQSLQPPRRQGGRGPGGAPPGRGRGDDGGPPDAERTMERPSGAYTPPDFTEPVGEPRMPTDCQLPGKSQLYALGLLTKLGDQTVARALREKVGSCTDDEVRRAMLLTIGRVGGPEDIDFLRTRASERADSYADDAEVAAELRRRLVALAALGAAQDADSLPRLAQMLDETPPPNEAITDVADYDGLRAWWRARLSQEVCQTIISICRDKQLFELTGDSALQRQLGDRLLGLIEHPGGGGNLGNAWNVLKARALRAYARCASPSDSGTLLVLKRVALAVPTQRAETGTRSMGRRDTEPVRSFERSSGRGGAARNQPARPSLDTLGNALRDAVVYVALHGGGLNMLGEVAGTEPSQAPDEAWSRILSDMANSPPPQYFDLVNMAPDSLTDECRQHILDATEGRAAKSDTAYAVFVASMIRQPIGEASAIEETKTVETTISAEEAFRRVTAPEEMIRARMEEERRQAEMGRAEQMGGSVQPAVREREEAPARQQKEYVRHGSRRKQDWAYSLQETADALRALRRKWAVVELLFQSDPTAVAAAVQQDRLYDHRDFGPEIAYRYALLSNAARQRVMQAMRDVLVTETQVVSGAGPGFVGTVTRTQSSPEAKRGAALVLRRLGGDPAADTLYDALVGTAVQEPAGTPAGMPMVRGEGGPGMAEVGPMMPERPMMMPRDTSGPEAASMWVARALGGLGRADLLRAALNARGRAAFDRNSVAVQMAALEGMAFLPDQNQAIDLLRELLGLASTPDLRQAVTNAMMRALQRSGVDENA